VRRILAAVLSGLLVVGCASKPPIDILPTIPIVVDCDLDLGAEPEYPDTIVALREAVGKGDLYTVTKLLLAGREMRIKRDAEKSAALKCQE
jgi:hypothetical protein